MCRQVVPMVRGLALRSDVECLLRDEQSANLPKRTIRVKRQNEARRGQALAHLPPHRAAKGLAGSFNRSAPAKPPRRPSASSPAG